MEAQARELFPGALVNRAYEETRAKYVSGEELRAQLSRVQRDWPAVRSRLAAQLIPFDELRGMLRRAGCPYDPAHIGISREHLRESYRQCCFMRRRFTILDFTQRLGVFPEMLDRLFARGGRWYEDEEARS